MEETTYYQKHKERLKEYSKEYYREHKEKINDYYKEYYRLNKYKYNYEEIRITTLINAYKRNDKMHNRNCPNEPYITKEYLLNVLFPKGCCYCGEKDYLKLGCDMIDNNKPHIISNCVCSCGRCNEVRQRRDFEEFFFEKYIEGIQK